MSDPDKESREDLEALEEEVLDGEIHEDLPDSEPRRVTLAAEFRGPLPPPDVLRQYEEIQEGLGREIVEQWKRETAHRHLTIDELRSTDREAMRRFYSGERLGQILGFLAILALAGVAVVAILEDAALVGVSALFVGGAASIWAMRRNSLSSAPPEPVDLGDADEIEGS